MKLIKPSVEYWGKAPTDVAGNLALIERAGRLCYKSEDRIGCSIRDPREFSPDYCSDEGRWDDINGGSARCDVGCRHHSVGKFVKKLYDAGHWAMLEHSNFVVRCQDHNAFGMIMTFIAGSKFLNYKVEGPAAGVYIGGNLTAWLHAWEMFNGTGPVWPFFKVWGEFFGLEPNREPYAPFDKMFEAVDEYPEELERHTTKFICDRGVSHELVRHRPASFAQESTRYVNYGGKDMEFIEPAGFENWRHQDQGNFKWSCKESEEIYGSMVKPAGVLTPQQARAVLPNALKTEIVVTADLAEWDHIFKLRTHSSAHPDMVRVMNMAKAHFPTL